MQYLIDSHSLDIVATDFNRVVRRRLYSRPLRKAPDGSLCVLQNSRAYPVVVDGDSSELIIVEDALSFDATICKAVEIGELYNISEVAWAGLTKARDDLKWEVQASTFGLYCYLKASDTAVEYVLKSILEATVFRIVTWDAIDIPIEYNWYIQFPVGLSIYSIRATIGEILQKYQNDFRENESLSLVAQSQEILIVQNSLSLARARIKELESSLLPKKIMSEELKAETTSITKLRRSDAEKVVCNIILSLFPKLALPPDTGKLILQRFTNSFMIWSVLSDLNSDRPIKQKAVKGIAGKAGWSEVDRHISTGSDSRGRVYTRPSRNGHKFDVVLHWKESSAEQERIFQKLANFSYFESPRSILNI